MNTINKNTKVYINRKLLGKDLRQDKNARDYLILEIEEENRSFRVFVFYSRFGENRWDELIEGNNYDFTCEEGKNGSANVLVDIKNLEEN